MKIAVALNIKHMGTNERSNSVEVHANISIREPSLSGWEWSCLPLRLQKVLWNDLLSEMVV